MATLMMSQIKTFYTPDDAEKVAQIMNETDDWTYIVKHDPAGTGYSFIEIYDEDDKFVDYL